MADNRKKYEVVISGVKHVLKLSAADAERYPKAKPVSGAKSSDK